MAEGSETKEDETTKDGGVTGADGDADQMKMDTADSNKNKEKMEVDNAGDGTTAKDAKEDDVSKIVMPETTEASVTTVSN
jgi:hypothetical protein